jgi:predicted transglutaminase-like cysteine proteinase
VPTRRPGVWLLVALSLGVTFEAAAAPLALFGTAEFRATSLAAIPQWRLALAALGAERAIYTACEPPAGACPSAALGPWLGLLARLRGLPETHQIDAVNRFVNAVPYSSDQALYGRRDHWATPLELFGRAGDCEDYAIAKYVSLRRLGLPADRLRIVVVEDTSRRTAHAILAVRTGGDVLILDNLAIDAMPQAQVTHYRPYYSVSEEARWAHVPTDALVVSATALTRPVATAAVDAASTLR